LEPKCDAPGKIRGNRPMNGAIKTTGTRN
jgi:hypothetical protein